MEWNLRNLKFHLNYLNEFYSSAKSPAYRLDMILSNYSCAAVMTSLCNDFTLIFFFDWTRCLISKIVKFNVVHRISTYFNENNAQENRENCTEQIGL